MEWLFRSGPPGIPEADWLLVGSRPVRMLLAPNRRARRYILRLRPDGVARVTIPRGGSAAEGRRFAGRNLAWLEQQWQRQQTQSANPKTWTTGTEIYFRGNLVRLESEPNAKAGVVRCGEEVLRVADLTGDLRPTVERHLWRLAARELPARVLELAAQHGLKVGRVTVRNQRSRWGSCSRHGTVSLNWRLIQAPPFVRDYILWHELMHLREMNHSARFWREVERVCPDYAAAERWLKHHSRLLR